MEANFFRLLCEELVGQLQGKRCVNIYCPTADHWVVKFGSREFLHLCPSPKGGALFLDVSSPENPPQPPARAMWFRKRLKGRRIIDVRSDWVFRRLALGVSPAGDEWLVLDLRTGPELQAELDNSFYSSPVWPALEAVLEDDAIWKSFPQLTPPLRKTLQTLSLSAAARLYRAVQAGEADGFHVYFKQERPLHVLSWPLPAPSNKGLTTKIFASASSAATAYGREEVKSLREQLDPERSELKRQLRRVRRSLKKLEQDETRLKEMVELQDQARLIQANLYRLDKQQKVAALRLTDASDQPVDIPLDARLTILENLDHMFRRVRKGKRGQEFIVRRRRQLQADLDTLRQGHLLKQAPAKPRKGKAKTSGLPARWRKLAVHVYRSSEGFLLLRGKNKKANHQLLSQAARPFDLWFHAEGGPGAHVILKRDHAGQDVGETSLEEAAVLAALSSHLASETKGRVICALVKDVRKIKGADHGQVRVDDVWASLTVNLDQDLEKRLQSDS